MRHLTVLLVLLVPLMGAKECSKKSYESCLMPCVKDIAYQAVTEHPELVPLWDEDFIRNECHVNWVQWQIDAGICEGPPAEETIDEQ